jgi:hypothetical protein
MKTFYLILLAAAALTRAAWQLPTTSPLEQSGCVKVQPAPRVPDAIAVPTGHQLLFGLAAKGVQIYEATRTQAGALEWKLLAPLAELTEPGDGRAIAGHHYDGPTWEATDGSALKAVDKKSAPAPNARNIPWLLLATKAEDGPAGRFTPVVYIQRVNTSGGAAPAEAPKRAGTRIGIPYDATYLFYGKE